MSRRESSLEWMLEIFDVEPDGRRGYRGTSDGGVRKVVDGSQVLAQAIVAAAKSFPELCVRSARAVFVGAVTPQETIDFTVDVVRSGRQFGTVIVTAAQAGRIRVTATVLLDRIWPDVIRHPTVTLTTEGPEAATSCDMAMIGREIRLVGIADVNDPDETGPARIDAWIRYDVVPERDDLRKALLAHFTGHLGISATMRGFAGVGTSMAHDTLSTAPMTITVVFHEPCRWSGWVLYRHESTYVGAGMSFVRGEILSTGGALLASFSQEAMIRTITPTDPAAAREEAARL